MKLSRYKDFINEHKEDIDSICRNYGIKNYTINRDGSIDVNGHLNLTYKKLIKLPLKFRRVTGNFNCCFNKLESLEGCPQTVGGAFYCSGNRLKSLEFCPQTVGGTFYCEDNKIFDFKGFPEYFEGYFSFSENPVNEILQLFNKHKNCIDWINEHDVIQGNKVILQRLEEVAYELKIELPNEIKLKNYEII